MSDLEAHMPQHSSHSSRLTPYRFQAIGPQLIQIGDIVELQVSFIAVPIQDNKYRISTVLRSISLFNGQFSQVRHAQTLSLPEAEPNNLGRILEKPYGKLSTTQVENPEEESRVCS